MYDTGPSKLHASHTTNPLTLPKVALFEILAEAAKQHPEKIAIAYLDREFTYAELDLLSSGFATALSRLGLVKGDRVALFLPNIPQFVIAYYGILKAGAIVTAVNPLHKELEVGHQLIDSEAVAIVTLDSLYPTVGKVWQKTSLKHAIVTQIDEYAEKILAMPTKIMNLAVTAFRDCLQSDTPPTKIAINPDGDLALLQYTGGTTGTAKAAMLTHTNLAADAFMFASWIKGAPAKEAFLTALPLSHIYGMTTSLNVPVALAAKMVLLPRFEPVNALSAIQRHNVTVLCGVPTMYQALLAQPELQKFCLASLHVCISGASPLPVQLQKSFIQSTGELLVEGYGLTEASPVTHCNPVDESLRTVNMGSIGLPLPGTEAKIVDAETGTKALPAGEVGELIVRGPQVMLGYWKSPQETALALRGGWLYTGDLAYRNAQGYFYLTDRKKDIIKHHGYSIYPREIEGILYGHTAVKLCAVVGKADPASGEVPKAFVVLKEDARATEQELVAFVNQKVASYKAVREVEFRQDLPLGPAGKVLKRLLKEESR